MILTTSLSTLPLKTVITLVQLKRKLRIFRVLSIETELKVLWVLLREPFFHKNVRNFLQVINIPDRMPFPLVGKILLQVDFQALLSEPEDVVRQVQVGRTNLRIERVYPDKPKLYHAVHSPLLARTFVDVQVHYSLVLFKRDFCVGVLCLVQKAIKIRGKFRCLVGLHGAFDDALQFNSFSLRLWAYYRDARLYMSLKRFVQLIFVLFLVNVFFVVIEIHEDVGLDWNRRGL